MAAGIAPPTLPLETQVAVLSTAMDGVLLDLERARMRAEDYAVAHLEKMRVKRVRDEWAHLVDQYERGRDEDEDDNGEDDGLCARGCGRDYHATYGGERLCIVCRRADAIGRTM